MITPKEVLSRGFWLGVFLMVALQLTVQDWYGFEGYIQQCKDHWFNMPWWIWPLIFLVFLLTQPKFVWDILSPQEPRGKDNESNH